MLTRLRDERFAAKRLTSDALLLAAALILSWLESMLPLALPLPGFKLGLANIAVVLAAHLAGRRDALIIMFSRVFIMSLLFGSAAGFAFSLGGGIAAFTVIALTKPAYGKLSLVGISVAAAAAHNTGQLIAACVLFMSTSPLGMLWWLLLLSIPAGILTGLPAEILFRRLGGNI